MDMFIIWILWFLSIYICKNLSNYILNKGNLYINYNSINLWKKKVGPWDLNFCKQKIDWERYTVPRMVYSLNDFSRYGQGGYSKRTFRWEDKGCWEQWTVKILSESRLGTAQGAILHTHLCVSWEAFMWPARSTSELLWTSDCSVSSILPFQNGDV